MRLEVEKVNSGGRWRGWEVREAMARVWGAGVVSREQVGPREWVGGVRRGKGEGKNTMRERGWMIGLVRV